VAKYGYGWRPSKPSFRHLKYEDASPLPWQEISDVTAGIPIFDQGQLGSCVSNSLSRILIKDLQDEKYKWPFVPSRLFLYYNGRVIENTVASDSGLEPADAIKVVATQGVCPEDSNPEWSWPYSSNDGRYLEKPPSLCYTDGLMHLALKYQQVPQNAASIQSALLSGLPVLFGWTVYNSAESDAVAQTGVIPLPGLFDSVAGGHCSHFVGQTSSIDAEGTPYYMFANSWGQWGKSGYGFIPQEYVLNSNLCSDFWIIQTVGPAAS
jgi:C1A family cysteine protease